MASEGLLMKSYGKNHWNWKLLYSNKNIYCKIFKTTLYFVGDGGNDVSMIQAANVGVGIVGKVRNVSHYPVLLMIKF